MAGHGSSGGNHGNWADEHKSTYEGFLKGSVALTLLCLYTLVALVCFRFSPTLNVFFGFAGLIAGVLTVAIDARTGGKWFLSGGVLVLFGLLVAFLIS
jgi:hypothetical protein